MKKAEEYPKQCLSAFHLFQDNDVRFTLRLCGKVNEKPYAIMTNFHEPRMYIFYTIVSINNSHNE